MKKKHSPNKASRENQAPKAQRGNNEAVNAARCIDPAISALQKFSKMERPPTPYGDVENGRVETEDSSQQVSDAAVVPKPPSDPHGSKERHNCRRKVKRRKDEDKNK
ncbi:hypothetical protein P5673_027962 [Acropora cervicornis]|uniref:Uncharacterized protein n=1 Tax=Acropora cervicornis TaxID=6130 RepID=A0AAD9PYV2_ACRCE|nr:hypothetical protein P5673_027962 [Acropora cervicornis]